VRTTYDRDANAVYIHLAEPPHRGGHATTTAESPPGINAFIALDWQDNRLVGIEILDADTILPQALIDQAEKPG
jgi:uncharacterized protein YuzE